LGSIGVLFYKNYGQKDLSWLKFFINFNYIMSIMGGVFVLLSLVYFTRKKPAPEPNEPITAATLS
jgi:hypothetical protein